MLNCHRAEVERVKLARAKVERTKLVRVKLARAKVHTPNWNDTIGSYPAFAFFSPSSTVVVRLLSNISISTTFIQDLYHSPYARIRHDRVLPRCRSNIGIGNVIVGSFLLVLLNSMALSHAIADLCTLRILPYLVRNSTQNTEIRICYVGYGNAHLLNTETLMVTYIYFYGNFLLRMWRHLLEMCKLLFIMLDARPHAIHLRPVTCIDNVVDNYRVEYHQMASYF